MDLNSLPKNASSLKFTKFDSNTMFKFDITQVTGLTNNDEVSKEFRPYKQMIERLNRTYKASYRPTNGFDSIDGANYDLAFCVAYYNFLRPHKHAGYKVLNEVELLKGAGNMPGKCHRPKPSESNIYNFQGSFEPIFLTQFFS